MYPYFKGLRVTFAAVIYYSTPQAIDVLQVFIEIKNILAKLSKLRRNKCVFRFSGFLIDVPSSAKNRKVSSKCRSG